MLSIQLGRSIPDLPPRAIFELDTQETKLAVGPIRCLLPLPRRRRRISLMSRPRHLGLLTPITRVCNGLTVVVRRAPQLDKALTRLAGVSLDGVEERVLRVVDSGRRQRQWCWHTHLRWPIEMVRVVMRRWLRHVGLHLLRREPGRGRGRVASRGILRVGHRHDNRPAEFRVRARRGVVNRFGYNLDAMRGISRVVRGSGNGLRVVWLGNIVLNGH